MEWVETTGRSVDEAKEAALDELGVDEQDAEFEIVAEARLGLFGRLRSEARVRARVRPTAPRAKDERRRKRRRTGADGEPASDASTAADDDAAATDSDSTPTAVSPAKAPATKASAAKRPASRPAAGGRSRARTAPAASAPQLPTAEPDAASEEPAGADDTTTAPDRPRRSRSAARRTSETPKENYPAASAGSQHPEEDGQVEVALEEQAKVAEAFLRGLADEMGVAAEVSVKQDGEESIELSLEGPELGLLIGPKGATLLALQDLTRTVVQRKTGASNGRLWVDVSGYRQKRAVALSRFAQQIANDVLASGTRKAMEPMSPADRKVVHDTINDIPGVATLSEGEDTNRRVVVYAVTD